MEKRKAQVHALFFFLRGMGRDPDHRTSKGIFMLGTSSLGQRTLRGIVGVVLAAATVASLAAANDVPPVLAGVNVVTAEQARKLIDSGTPAIDTRVGNEYADAHIKGAKNVPYKERSAKMDSFNPKEDRFDLTQLPADKNAAILFYCNGPECWKSYKASSVAAAAGYKNVQWLRGGLPEWKAKGYPVE